jgi:hypothetical protein
MRSWIQRGVSPLKVLYAGLFACALVLSSVYVPTSAVTSPSCDVKSHLCTSEGLLSLDDTLAALKVPVVDTPVWMTAKVTFNYSVQTRGTITASITEFKALVNETLNDVKGWSQMDVRFNEVASGGNFTMYLASSAEMTSFSSTGCSASWSCTVGNSVIINQDRWLGASDAWNAAKGTLRDYRHMVVNHETGHWLGNGHQNCGGAGQPAPVMQQQSVDLQGCTFNPWPLKSELKSSRL